MKIDLTLVDREKTKKKPDLNSNEPDISTNTILIRLITAEDSNSN